MKLKELPASIYHQLRLRGIPLGKLTDPNRPQAPVVVSLASIPSRLHVVDLVVRCLLDQDLRPERIVLWLHQSVAGKVPSRLEALEKGPFEIRYTPLDYPHTKLIHTLEQFPGRPVVTCDDDLIYTRDWLRTLYQAHLDTPGCIVANRLRYIRRDERGTLLPYREWVRPEAGAEDPRNLLPIGSAGVLYPSGSLDPRVQDQAAFDALCPRADDLWFKMMGLLQGTCLAEPARDFPEPTPILGSQRVTLKKSNIGGDANALQWQRLSDYYSIRV